MTPRMSTIVQSAPKDDLQYLIFLPDYSTLNICIQFLADMEFLSLGRQTSQDRVLKVLVLSNKVLVLMPKVSVLVLVLKLGLGIVFWQ